MNATHSGNSASQPPLDLNRLLNLSTALTRAAIACRQGNAEPAHLDHAIERLVLLVTPRDEGASRAQLLALIEVMRSRNRRLTKQLERLGRQGHPPHT